MPTHPYVRWTKRLSEVDSSEERRALMSEVAVHRARSLGNLIEVREATWALSQLHASVGEHDKAVLEGRSLLSLAGGTPPASDEEVDSARGWLASLGVTDAPRVRLAPRAPEGRRKGRGRRDDPPSSSGREAAPRFLQDARRAGVEGRFEEALLCVKGKKGVAVEAVRSWLLLRKALGASDEEREGLLRELEHYMARRAEVSKPGKRQDKVGDEGSRDSSSKPDSVPDDGPLGALFGGMIPRRREGLIRAVDAHVQAHPELLDALASAVLKNHVMRAGERRVAPWWIGLVARVMCTTNYEKTEQTLADLSGAYAVTAYSEEGFKFLIGMGRVAVAQGWQVLGVRRGLLKKGEPGDVRMWTMTLRDGEGCERTIVHGPLSETPPADPTRVGQVLARGVSLGDVVGVHALGAGHAALREQALAAGHGGWEGTDPQALIEALGALEAQPGRRRSGNEARGQANDALRALLADSGPLDSEKLTQAVAAIRRRRDVCRIVGETVPELDDARVVEVAQVCLLAWSEATRLPELTSLLVATSAKGGAASRALLVDPAHAVRMGGPGIDVLTDLAATAGGEGWSVARVLAGVTRRERETDTLLSSSADALEGLWRMELQKGDVRGDLWYLQGLSDEGREGLMKMLAKPGQRLMIFPSGEEGLGGTADTSGSFSWSDTEAQALCEHLASWGAPSKGDT